MSCQALRRSEALYAASFAAVMLERQIARAEGQRTEDETRSLNAHIANLGTQLASVASEHAAIDAQHHKAEEDLSELAPFVQPVKCQHQRWKCLKCTYVEHKAVHGASGGSTAGPRCKETRGYDHSLCSGIIVAAGTTYQH